MNPHFGQTAEAAKTSPPPCKEHLISAKDFRPTERFSGSASLEPAVVAPGSIDRWISFELGRLNAGLVVEKKTLTRLLAEPEPECRTREGDPHPFDRTALDRYAAVLTREEADDLRLPLTLVASADSDSAYLTDELGAKAVRAVEKFGRAFPFRDGRMALPHSLAMDLVRRHGGAVQLAFG
ncbi:MAG: DUF61 family protein [Methanobacteriota archaeon]|nr:MAG: DUF61 family protein [Euryarchaeota archaeon]